MRPVGARREVDCRWASVASVVRGGIDRILRHARGRAMTGGHALPHRRHGDVANADECATRVQAVDGMDATRSRRSGEALERHGLASACTRGACRRPAPSGEEDAGRPQAVAGIHGMIGRRHPQAVAGAGAATRVTVHFSPGMAWEACSRAEGARTVVAPRWRVNATGWFARRFGCEAWRSSGARRSPSRCAVLRASQSASCCRRPATNRRHRRAGPHRCRSLPPGCLRRASTRRSGGPGARSAGSAATPCRVR